MIGNSIGFGEKTQDFLFKMSHLRMLIWSPDQPPDPVHLRTIDIALDG